MLPESESKYTHGQDKPERFSEEERLRDIEGYVWSHSHDIGVISRALKENRQEDRKIVNKFIGALGGAIVGATSGYIAAELIVEYYQELYQGLVQDYSLICIRGGVFFAATTLGSLLGPPIYSWVLKFLST